MKKIMFNLKMQLTMSFIFAIAILIFWSLATVLRAILSSLTIPVLIIAICYILYKFMNLK